jgi:dUTPase
MVVSPVIQIGWETVEAISETSRNAGGFGHTGKI